MIIMGNAELLSGRSEMWKTVIDDLREAKRLGPGLPISCFNHPEYVKYVTEPEMIPLISPDGECCHFDHLSGLIKPQGGAFDLAASVLTVDTVALRRYIGSALTIVDTEHYVTTSSVTRMIMPRCVATNAVGKSVLKVIRVTLNAGNPVGTVNGRLPKWNYRVATVKITSRGKLG
jgi:hypothetical protein